MQYWIFPIRSRATVVLAAAFVLMTLTVMSGVLNGMDRAAAAAAQDISGNDVWDLTVQLITETGDIWYMLILGVLLIVIRRTRKVGITLMIFLVVSTILAGYIKCGVDRDRPEAMYDSIQLPVEISRDTFALFCEGGYAASYPSGHALRSVGIAILLMFSYVHFIGDIVTGLAASILDGVSMNQRIADFSRGVIDTSSVVFFLSLTAVFIFLTIRSLETRRWR